MSQHARATGLLPFREELTQCLRFIKRPSLKRTFANRPAAARGLVARHST